MPACPCCASGATQRVVLTPPMPVNPCVLVRSAAASRNAIRRPIDLQGCTECGFLWNAMFDETIVTYDQSYEGTQSHSAHFQTYLNQTAADWSETLSGVASAILEVGCGQGEFLDALAETTDARLVGYDPAYRLGDLRRGTIIAERLPASANDTFGAVINRMTLEHIADPFSFVGMMANWVAKDGYLVTQVPNAERMVSQSLYCDLIYEHVNYFTPQAIVRLFERAGFADNRCALSYDNQHLTVFSRRSPASGGTVETMSPQAFQMFSAAIGSFAQDWSNQLARYRQAGSEIFIWGAGSRATTFINALSDPGVIAGAIDINPRRAGTFIQGTACETHLPGVLRNRSNLKIVVMNPIYHDEISGLLTDMSISATLILLDHATQKRAAPDAAL